MRRKTLIMLSLFALSGCTSATISNERESAKQTLDSLVGQPLARFVLSAGPPTGEIDLGHGRRAFQWERRGTRQTAGYIGGFRFATFYTNPQVHVTECRLSIVAITTKSKPTLSDWIIEGWQAGGDGC